jgi:hypothetical protein
MFERVLPAAAMVAALPLITTTALAGGCVHEECYAKVRAPDVYRTVLEPVVVRPARTEIVTTPAVYGAIARQVEVVPARAWHSVAPAVYGTVEREVVVKPGGWRWQRSVDRHGRETMCKVYVAPETRTVTATVLVEPARRITHVTPAVYREEYRTVLLKPAETHRLYHPAVFTYRSRDVLVRRGGWRWERTW